MKPLPLLLLLFPLFLGCTITDPTPVPAPAPAPGPRGVPPADPAPSPPGETTDRDPGPPAARTDHAKLVFTAEGHYFGRMEKHQKASHTAVFYNAGREPLEISKVVTHCGCAAALLSSRTVPPGGRGTMKVTMDSGSLPGKRTKTVEVFTNDPAEPVARYPISCDVIADAALDPIVVVIRATRSAGEVTAHFDVLSIRPGFDLRITGVTTSDENLLAEVSPLPPGTGRTGYRVNLRLAPGFGTRDFHEKVTVRTNSARDPRLTVSVLGSVRQAVLAVPERIYFPRLTPGDVFTRSLFVYRADGKPLEVTGVDDASGFFEIEKRRESGSKWEITVKIAGEAPKETVRGSLIVLTDAAEDPRVTVPFEVPGEAVR